MGQGETEDKLKEKNIVYRRGEATENTAREQTYLFAAWVHISLYARTQPNTLDTHLRGTAYTYK